MVSTINTANNGGVTVNGVLASVPGGVCSEKERTAYEMYQYLSDTIAKNDGGVSEDDGRMLLRLFTAARQFEHGATTQQKLPLKLELVTSLEPEFAKWAHKQLTSYVGQGPVRAAAQPQLQLQQQAFQAEVYLNSVTQVFTEFASTQRTAWSEQAKKSEEGKTYNEYNIAALCGFCGVTYPGQCPAIYPMFKLSKNIEDARANIMRGMEVFADEEKLKLDRGIYLTDEVEKDIMKIRPNPFGTIGTAECSDREVSNLVVLPRTNEEIEKMRMLERAVEESKCSRTQQPQPIFI
jgi:hypothetical protein